MVPFYTSQVRVSMTLSTSHTHDTTGNILKHGQILVTQTSSKIHKMDCKSAVRTTTFDMQLRTSQAELHLHPRRAYPKQNNGTHGNIDNQ